MLNYNYWITEVVLYRGDLKHTAKDLERTSSKAEGKGCSVLSWASNMCVYKVEGLDHAIFACLSGDQNLAFKQLFSC